MINPQNLNQVFHLKLVIDEGKIGIKTPKTISPIGSNPDPNLFLSKEKG